jgi:hypothetical protein
VPFEIAPERDTEVKVTMGPPAKMRVRFVAAQPVVVKFRVIAGRELAYPYPEGTGTVAETDDEQGLPVFHAGAEGLVLSGLGAGRHTVEVVSEELSAPPTSVDLVVGETRDVEISVSLR